jgi:putative ABC transport system substrate-binding protein
VTRRNIIAIAASCGVLHPWRARAQATAERTRRIAVFSYLNGDDREAHNYDGAFLHAMEQLGWAVGRNLRVEYRWTGGRAELPRRHAEELVALAPDVVLVAGAVNAGALLELTRALPVVFVQVTDAVGSGLVRSLANPGGNATGFINFEFSIAVKWLELLKEIAPDVARVAVLRDPTNPNGTAQFGAIQAAAASFRVETTPIQLRDATEIDRGLSEFARTGHGGVIVTPSGLAINQRDVIIALAARHRLPAIYPLRLFAIAGGLVAYGPDEIDQYRRAAGYVDRILRGEQPSGLPVQASARLALVVNRRAAAAMGLAILPELMVRADEVIE